MAPDQAAGLRRRSAARAVRCLHLVSPSTAPARLLVEALSRQGLRTLLIDAHGRHFPRIPRSMFGWRQQLATRQLQTVAIPGGDGWPAPGIEAHAAELAGLSALYDWLVFDAGPAGGVGRLAAGDVMVLDVGPTILSGAYRLLKTLAHGRSASEIVLLGDAAACAHLESACRQFLGVAFAQKIGNLADEADAIDVLAVRMAGEETGPRAVA